MTRACCLALVGILGVTGIDPGPLFAQGPAPGYPGSAPQAAPQPPAGFPSPYYSDAYSDAYCPPGSEDQWYGGYEEGQAALPKAGKKVIFDGWSFRTEYLNWRTSGPGDTLLGAPIPGNPDPSFPFHANAGFGNPTTAVVPSTSQMQLKHANGIRGTLAADFLYGGSMEVSAFYLARSQGSIQYDNLLNSGFMVATSTLVDNQPANNLYFYNSSYRADFTSRMWGADANYFFDLDRTGFIEFRPLVGARYLQVRENLHQNGVFVDTNFGDTIVTDINSIAMNNLWGPQAGFRLEGVTKFIVVGVEPKFAVMGNSGYADVSSQHFRSNADPLTGNRDHYTSIAGVVDIGVYGKVNLSPNLSLRIGYSYMVISGISRPDGNIVYNDNGALAPPGIVGQASNHRSLNVQGLTLGGELRF